jgi:hypothetical protein
MDDKHIVGLRRLLAGFERGVGVLRGGHYKQLSTRRSCKNKNGLPGKYGCPYKDKTNAAYPL